MNAKQSLFRTLSRAMVLAPCLLLLVAAAPFGVDSAVEAQVAGVATNADPNLEWAIAEQRKLVQSRSSPRARATALNDLANLLELRGDVAAAFEHYREALAADGTCAPAHYNLALLAYTTGDSELAASHLQTAIELEPGNAWAHYQLGRIADDAGEAEKAVEHYIRAVSLDTHLAFADVNPHFTVNRYATEILLRADRTRAKALPPRTYSQPARISGLLVSARVEEAAPRPDEVVESQEDKVGESQENRAANAERGEVVKSVGVDRERLGRVNRSSVPTGADADLFGAPTILPVTSRTPATASVLDEPAEPATDRGIEKEARVFTRDDLRRRTLVGGSVAGVPSGTQPSSSPASGRRGAIQMGTPVGPGGRQPAPGLSSGTFGGSRGGRFEPNSRSSAQLEVRIRRVAEPAP